MVKTTALIKNGPLTSRDLSEWSTCLMIRSVDGKKRGHITLKFSMDFSDNGEINSLALQTRNLHKFYGTGKKAFHVLRGLDVDVPYGTM